MTRRCHGYDHGPRSQGTPVRHGVAFRFLLAALPTLAMQGCACPGEFNCYCLSVQNVDGEPITDAIITIIDGRVSPEYRGCEEWSDYCTGFCLWTDNGSIDGLSDTLTVRIEKEGYETVTRSFEFEDNRCGISKVRGDLRVIMVPVD